ncbi:MAG TPA: hypothetical protein VMW83_04315 [Spirochaetia bacterium]|nr:hypothetical protein [Spirochaetia bacterium]
MADDTLLVGVIDMVIRDIRDKSATRVNFVAPGSAVSPSPEQKEDLLALKTAVLTGPPASQPKEGPSPGLLFIPLPINSPLYPNARFFLATKEDGGKTAGGKDKSPSSHLVIGIDTENLGQLWFNVAAGSNDLLIKCFAEKEEVSRFIRASLPGLKSTLEELAFGKIDLLSLTDPVLENLERPGSPDEGFGSLIDIEV